MDKAKEYNFLRELVSRDTLDELAKPLIAYLRSSFDAQTVTLIRFWRDSEPDILINHIQDDRLSHFFANNYVKVGYILDPFFIVAFGSEKYTAQQLRMIAPDRYETSEYYARYYAETGLIDELGATLRIAPQVALHLSLGRMRSKGRFRAHELNYFRLLSPVVMSKLEKVTQRPPELHEIHRGSDLASRYQRLSAALDRKLSRREAEISALIVQGHSSRAVGLRLGISDQTVKVHRRNIYKKLNISSQNELFSLLMTEMRGLSDAFSHDP